MDGAHTHHHGPSGAGIGAALLIGAGLALAAPAARAVAAMFPAVLIGLAVAAALAVTGLTFYAVIACWRRRAGYRQLTPGPLPTGLDHVPLAGDREVVSLRQAITELQAQLCAARAALPAEHRPEVHQHLHLHGLDPGQVAAILAAYRREAGDGQ